jgi:hypothetical protein
MRRSAAILILLAVASCKPKPPEPTPAARGASVFTPVADKVGEATALDLKAQNEKAYTQYLAETGSKDEVQLGQRIGRELLAHYASSLSLSEAQEAAMKAGKFDDAGNTKMLDYAIGKYADSKTEVPKACQLALQKVQSGEWKKGLPLEFTVRMLMGHLATPPQPHKD